EPGCATGRTSPPRPQGRVTLDCVNFRYTPGGPEVLHGFSMEALPGEVIAIVGRSGSGKSTLARLIQRLYVPESGRVLVDGLNLVMVDSAWLRRHVGVVLQENVLFNRTVRENIALADPGSSMPRVMLAAKLAGAHEFILDLPEGYDTMVGEHGCTLSGGQRQRIAIARALLNNPRILIFDEATSALDYESEHLIQQNMRHICKDRTVFIIAHRASALRIADRICVIDRGRITESGTHQQLLRLNSYYARLSQHQLGMAAPN
ncbi:MAG: ATP-binding cassette domain-containing protein, partial [Gammaproteobacteria bacterium]